MSGIQVLNCQKCNQCLKCHKSLGSLFEGALNVFVFVIVFVFVFVIVIVMSPHLFDQMSQRSPVSRIALWRCSLNVVVFVIVFVFVFVFVIVFLMVRSYPLITLVKCLKGHKSLGSICYCVFKKVTHSLTD